jgi:hypothetical protein
VERANASETKPEDHKDFKDKQKPRLLYEVPHPLQGASQDGLRRAIIF